jgi:hypothetical protein
MHFTSVIVVSQYLDLAAVSEHLLYNFVFIILYRF